MAAIRTAKFETRGQAYAALERNGWTMINDEGQIYRLASATNFVDARKRAEVVFVRTNIGLPLKEEAYYSIRFFDVAELETLRSTAPPLGCGPEDFRGSDHEVTATERRINEENARRANRAQNCNPLGSKSLGAIFAAHSAIGAMSPKIIVLPDDFGRAIDIPTTYPDGSGHLSAYEWVQWAKRELLYGTNPPPKKD